MRKISAALITYNEEANIERSLNKLLWCDEIVVIDSYSTDKTVEICKQYNAKVFLKKFEGFGDQKQFMVSKCTNDWILSIDADEVLSDELIKEIQLEFSKEKIDYGAYYLNRRHVFLGRVFKHGKLKKEAILRLFNKNDAQFTNRRVHERVIHSGDCGRFKSLIMHYTVTSISQMSYKKEFYATLSSEEYFSKKESINSIYIYLKYPYTFFKEYFFNWNFLNGYQGYVWSVTCAEGNLLKYLKLKEKQKKVKRA